MMKIINKQFNQKKDRIATYMKRYLYYFLSPLVMLFFISLLLLPILATPHHGQAGKSHLLGASIRRKIFTLVWTRVRDRHYDPKMNGLDWNAVRTRYMPRALKASATDAQFYTILNEMLGELKQSHLGVVPLSEVSEIGGKEAPAGGGNGETGITALLVGEEVVITRVAEGSGAAKAGLKPGLALLAINGKPLTPLLKTLSDRRPALRLEEKRVRIWAGVRHMLAGSAGSHIPIRTKSAGEAKEVVYNVTLGTPVGQIIQFGALPPLPSEVETKTLDGGIGYIRFNIFLVPLLDQIRQAIVKMAADNASAIILDLRGNPGGIGAMACGVAGLFLNKEANLGMMQTRTSQLRFPIFPQEPQYSGPLVILTDEASLSTSEILAAGLQEIKRAVVIGRTTGGMVLPSQVEELPGGGEFQFVFADFHTPKGVRLEGQGVKPDIPVELTQEGLLAHPDPILDAALAYIHTHSEQASKPTNL